MSFATKDEVGRSCGTYCFGEYKKTMDIVEELSVMRLRMSSLFKRYDSRICLFMRFLSTAFLTLRFTANPTFTFGSTRGSAEGFAITKQVRRLPSNFLPLLKIS